MLTAILAFCGYLIVGNFIADRVPAKPQHMAQEPHYLCRPQCVGKLNVMPWPLRSGKLIECPVDGDRDFCTGEIYTYGRWVASNRLIECAWHPLRRDQVLEIERQACVEKTAKENPDHGR